MYVFIELLCPLACTIYYPFILSKLMMTTSLWLRFLFWNVTKNSGGKHSSTEERERNQTKQHKKQQQQ